MIINVTNNNDILKTTKVNCIRRGSMASRCASRGLQLMSGKASCMVLYKSQHGMRQKIVIDITPQNCRKTLRF